MATCGEYLVKLLEAYGVELIFGIPGVHTVELYRGLPATRIRHITPRHEQGAGFMADGYARVTGKPGVCFIITGPGMTNIATAMGQAYAEFGADAGDLGVNARDATRHAAGPAARAALAAGAGRRRLRIQPHDARRPSNSGNPGPCLRRLRSQRPRPVHIEIPLDVIVAEMDDRARRPGRCRPARRRDRQRSRRRQRCSHGTSVR